LSRARGVLRSPLPAVMAMHSAERRHGGGGALYVLLRKSERKKAENRERHQKRLG
jgi:hypothetical protein